MRRIAGWLLLSWVMVAGAAEPRRQVGQVQGAPVYADQITGDTAQARAESAAAVFMSPIIKQWTARHAEAARPTREERAQVESAISAYAACSGNGYTLPDQPEQRELVVTMLTTNVKLQKRLYDEYGGGRLLFQQAGIEAFDATRKMLEAREAEGAFSFSDPGIRALAYDYWTRDHGAFMITDHDKIAKALDVTSMIARCPAT